MFNNCMQAEPKSLDNYYIKLRKLVRKCEFRDFENDLLRDRVVLGINNNELRRRLMAKADLTLAKCIEICKIEEVTIKRLDDINENDEKMVHKIKGKNTYKTKKLCLFCGNENESKKIYN